VQNARDRGDASCGEVSRRDKGSARDEGSRVGNAMQGDARAGGGLGEGSRRDEGSRVGEERAGVEARTRGKARSCGAGSMRSEGSRRGEG
jgi:hypothetical protein